MTRKTIILGIIFLVTLDQGIKIVIANYFIETKFDIIDSVLGFHPIFNDRYSYFNIISNLNLGLLPHAILLIILQLLIIFYYDYSKTIQGSTKILDLAFIFGESALICVFCGFFFWKDGILDFLFLYPFIFDLKDIYLNGFVIFFLYNHYKYKIERQSSTIKINEYLKDKYLLLKQFIRKI